MLLNFTFYEKSVITEDRSVSFWLHLTLTLSPTIRNRSSHRRCSVKKGNLRNFCKIHRKILFFNKVAGLDDCFFRKYSEILFLPDVK